MVRATLYLAPGCTITLVRWEDERQSGIQARQGDGARDGRQESGVRLVPTSTTGSMERVGGLAVLADLEKGPMVSRTQISKIKLCQSTIGYSA